MAKTWIKPLKKKSKQVKNMDGKNKNEMENNNIKKKGPSWELNPGPPAPKAGIIPLDHTAVSYGQVETEIYS